MVFSPMKKRPHSVRYGSVSVSRVTSEVLRQLDTGVFYITNKRLHIAAVRLVIGALSDPDRLPQPLMTWNMASTISLLLLYPLSIVAVLGLALSFIRRFQGVRVSHRSSCDDGGRGPSGHGGRPGRLLQMDHGLSGMA
jgi:hypothetical protein